MKYAMMLLLLTTACSTTATPKWTTADKVMFTTYSALTVVDILQTRYAMDSDDFDEANPILEPLGKDGATAVMVGSNIALYFLVDRMNEKHRSPVLGILNMLKLGVVGHNAMIGVELGW